MVAQGNTGTPPQLHEIPPREVAGRDTVARFEAQFRGAAVACLRILDQKGPDRVYCDFQDDFVTREQVDGLPVYHFVQVKTKAARKYQWTRSDLFGLAKNVPGASKNAASSGPKYTYKTPSSEQLTKVKDSFVGKLLEHTARFSTACGSVTFLTNSHLSDDVESIANAILEGDFEERTVGYLFQHYALINSFLDPPGEDEVRAAIKKLSFTADVDYVDPGHNDFEIKAGKVLLEFSEIDLNHNESSELATKLLALVQSKSSRKLVAELTAQELDDMAGIGLEDLLALLPISKAAYYNFINSGDEKALKNASILQRRLSQAGASSEIIETASRWKIEWDNWFRTHRHAYEYDLLFLKAEVAAIYDKWAKGNVSFAGLRHEVLALRSTISVRHIAAMVSDEILVGGVLACLVRGETNGV